METRRVLKLFLASPSDTDAERKIVHEVVNSWNRSTGAGRGWQVDVFDYTKNVAPSFGRDGQKIINEASGSLRNYAFFIGILKHRFGSPTPRAASGTKEEFGRAVRAYKSTGRIEIMLYFSDAPLKDTSNDSLIHKQKLNDFRKSVQHESFYKTFKSQTDFRAQFNEHFVMQVEKQIKVYSKAARKKTRTQPAAESAPVKSPPKPKPSHPKPLAPATTVETPKPISTPRTKKTQTPTTKPSTKTVRKPSATGATISTAGKWLLLDGRLWRSDSVSGEGNELVLKIVSRNGDEESVLRRLCERNHFPNLPFAYGRDAGQFRLNKSEHESVGKNTLWTLRGSLQRFTQNSFRAPEETERRARELLIGTTKDFDAQQAALLNSSGTAGIYNSLNAFPQPNPSLFASLLKETGLKPAEFLPFAFLHAVYRLKHDGICEDVLELKLGPVKDKTLRVHFKGRTAQNYNNSTQIIEVKGESVLSI